MITFACPGCGQKLKAADEQAGNKARCRRCGGIAPIPGPAIAVAPEGPTLASEAPVNETAGRPADSVGQTVPLAPEAPPCPAPSRPPGIPGYELHCELGRGGMGVVYKARHLALNRVVALKMILAGGHAGPAELARFKTEAEAIARLQHPNIVQIHEVGQHDGMPFFSLEFCAGGSLEKKLGGTPLPPKQAAALLEQLARAMDAAHRQDVIHRDLKPANVLLTKEGTPKVTDFGLAKKLDEVGQTQTNAVVGTPSYMAPEQAEGSKQVGARADVYALGAILYECLTGRPPFKAATVLDTLLQVASDEPVAPRQLNAKVPRDLETICLKCLYKEPARRYASAGDLADDLGRFQAGEPIRARPAGAVARALNWARRRRALAAVVVVSVAAAVSLATGGAFFTARLAEQVSRAERAEGEANDRAEEAEREKLNAERLARLEADASRLAQQEKYAAIAARKDAFAALAEKIDKLRESYLSQAQARRNSQLVGQRFASLSALSEAANIRPGLRLRNEVIASLALLDLRPSNAPFLAPGVVHRQGAPNRITVCRATGLVATINPDRKTVTVRDNRGQLIVEMAHPQIIDIMHWRRDGKYLAVGGADTCVHVWKIPEGKQQCVLEGHQSGIISLEYSPQGNVLASTSYDGDGRLWDPISGRRLLRSPFPFSGPFSADGRQLGNGGGILDVADGRECRVLHHGTVGRGGDRSSYQHGVWGCDFSPDGRVLATAQINGAVLWDVETGDELARLPGVGGVAFAPNGDLWMTTKGAVSHWPAQWHHGGGPRARYGPPKFVPLPGAFGYTNNCNLAISRDGAFIVAPDMHQNCAWVVRTDKPNAVTKLAQPACMHAAISLDGKLIVTSSWAWHPPRPISVYRTDTGRLAHKITHFPFARTAFSPDGSILATASQSSYTLLDTRGWKELKSVPWSSHLPGQVDFSPDGRLLATIAANHVVRLLDPKTGGEIATLTPPEQLLISGVRFSPGGTHLAAITEPNRVYLWDLRAIRRQLRGMGLDWDHPPLGPAPRQVVPLRVHVMTNGP
jgi:WD40 repeat protein